MELHLPVTGAAAAATMTATATGTATATATATASASTAPPVAAATGGGEWQKQGSPVAVASCRVSTFSGGGETYRTSLLPAVVPLGTDEINQCCSVRGI